MASKIKCLIRTLVKTLERCLLQTPIRKLNSHNPPPFSSYQMAPNKSQLSNTFPTVSLHAVAYQYLSSHTFPRVNYNFIRINNTVSTILINMKNDSNVRKHWLIIKSQSSAMANKSRNSVFHLIKLEKCLEFNFSYQPKLNLTLGRVFLNFNTVAWEHVLLSAPQSQT